MMVLKQKILQSLYSVWVCYLQCLFHGFPRPDDGDPAIALLILEPLILALCGRGDLDKRVGQLVEPLFNDHPDQPVSHELEV